MTATQVTNRRTAPIVRDGTAELDTAGVDALRAYVLAADEHQSAKTRMDAARAELDRVAGAASELTYSGSPVLSFTPTDRRTVDMDRLAARHPEAYADVATETAGYRLSIGADVRSALRAARWRQALRKRAS